MSLKQLWKLIVVLLVVAIAIVLILAPPNCCHIQEDPPRPDAGSESPEDSKEEQIDPEALCLPAETEALQCDALCSPTERTVRVSLEAQCQDVPPWRMTVRESLRWRYCHYSLQGPALLDRLDVEAPALATRFRENKRIAISGVRQLSPTERQALTAVANLGAPEGSEPDCVVLPTQTNLASNAVDNFGAGSDVSLTLPDTNSTGPISVRVAVIDTAASDTTAPSHGTTIAGIVRSYACTGTTTPCDVEVRSYQGMPRVLLDDLTVSTATAGNGGQFGFQSDVAAAIEQAVIEWKADKLNGGPEHLILNLSLGWESECGGNAQILRASLDEAADEGALTIVAAGNRASGTCASGLTGPAHWLPQPQSTDPSLPMLYAITAVGPGGARMSTHRPGSHTQLAARGYGAFAEVNGVMEGPLSGSSVATAIASGTAARVWSILMHDTVSPPARTAADVIDLLYQSGSEGNTTAEVFFGPTSANGPPVQKTINLCSAATLACQKTGECNPTCTTTEAVPAQEPGEDFRDAFDQAVRHTVDQAPTIATKCVTCSSDMETSLIGDFTDTAIPNPWVVPQPGDTVCSICGLEDNELSVKLKNNGGNLTPVSTTVEIVGSGGNQHFARQYNVQVFPIEWGEAHVLEDAELATWTSNSNATATVHFTFAKPNGAYVYYSEALPMY